MKERFEKVGTVPTYYDMELMVKSKITEPITMNKALALLKFLKESENLLSLFQIRKQTVGHGHAGGIAERVGCGPQCLSIQRSGGHEDHRR